MLPLSLLGSFFRSASPYLSVFLLASLTSHFGTLAPSALLLASCSYFFFRSYSPSLHIFLFLGCTEIHDRVSRRFSLSSPSPTAIRLFPLGHSPPGSFYPFGVFHRLRLDFALALLFLEFFSSSGLISLRCYFFVSAVSCTGCL